MSPRTSTSSSTPIPAPVAPAAEGEHHHADDGHPAGGQHRIATGLIRRFGNRRWPDATNPDVPGVRITDVELRRVRLPLVAPFKTGFRETWERDALLVKVATAEGRAGVSARPWLSPNSSEYADGARPMVSMMEILSGASSIPGLRP